MHKRTRFLLGALAVAALLPSFALAAEKTEAFDTKVVAHDDDNDSGGDPKFAEELVMGFAAGVLDPSYFPFALKSQPAEGNGLGLAAPFGGPSLTRVTMAGPLWELRTIQSHGRFTLGLGVPFGEFRPSSLDTDVDINGATSRLQPRSLMLWQLRLGLGAEWSFKRVTFFADVLGDIQFASATVVLDGQQLDYRATAFGLSARAGASLRLDRMLSLSVAGEYGLLGTPRFGGSVTMGWSWGRR